MNLEDFISKIPEFGSLPHTQRFIYFGFFITEVKRGKVFTLEAIKKLYNDASLDLPTNPPDIICKLKTQKRFIPADSGYRLHRDTIGELRKEIFGTPPRIQTTSHLEGLIDKITDKDEKSYLEEVLKCYKVMAPRASVVLTWILCINRLQNYISTHNKLNDFNQALTTSYPKIASKIGHISDKDGFEDLKESIFVDVCKDAGIITKTIWKMLKEKLDFRNSCGHPSDIVVPESKVTSFIEDILHNVLFKYTI